METNQLFQVIGIPKRLKYDIENLENALLITSQLYPKKYMKKCKIDDVSGNGKFQIGLIAQDILDKSRIRGLNKLVAGGDYYDGKLDARVASPYSIKYNDIHIITLGAVKELDKIVQQQQAQINMLTNRLILCEKKKKEKTIGCSLKKKIVVTYMSKYYFIIFRNNDDTSDFHIIASKIADYRKKDSNMKYNYNKYLKYGGTYKEIYKILEKDYSSYCCFRGDFSTLEEVKLKLDELTEFYQAKFLSNNNI